MAQATGIEVHEGGDGERLYVISHPIFDQLTGEQVDVSHAKIRTKLELEKLDKLKEELDRRKAFIVALGKLPVGYSPSPKIDVPEGILRGQ